jgi:uncharacterized protein (TIGR02271 family)
MTNPTDVQNLIGRTAVDHEGNKIGKVGQVYLDDQTGQPQWVTISTGLFGNKESFAPIAGSSLNDDDLVLAVSKDQVKGAPNLDADGHLEDSENGELYSYYSGSDQANGQISSAQTNGQATYVDGDGDTGYTSGAQGHDTSGPTTDDAMTRSEEQLTVGTEQVETGRARLRKYVVTEDVTTTVPVSHEEVRLEREPITDANRDDALSGGDITEEEHEVTLHAEQPVVAKETVPVERVRLGTETVTEDQEVTEQVRKEQIDTPDVETAPSER